MDLHRFASVGSPTRRLFPPEELTELSKPPANLHQNQKRPQRKYLRDFQCTRRPAAERSARTGQPLVP